MMEEDNKTNTEETNTFESAEVSSEPTASHEVPATKEISDEPNVTSVPAYSVAHETTSVSADHQAPLVPQEGTTVLHHRLHKKNLIGTVVSTKMSKTIVVRVETLIKHPVFKKYISSSKKFMAHDQENQCNKGDFVRIAECRPLSRHKSFRLVEIIKRTEEIQTDDHKKASAKASLKTNSKVSLKSGKAKRGKK